MSKKIKLELGVPEFMNSNKDLLVIVADPKSDIIMVGYNGKQTSGIIKRADGKKTKTIRRLLQHTQFDNIKGRALFTEKFDDFMVGLVDLTKAGLSEGRLFYSYLDGAIFNITRALNADKGVKKEDL